jgi:hypothetical protein
LACKYAISVVLGVVYVVDMAIAYVQCMLLVLFVNSVVYSWTVQAAPSNTQLEVALTFYKVANEGAGGFVQGMIAHVWSNTLGAGLDLAEAM